MDTLTLDRPVTGFRTTPRFIIQSGIPVPERGRNFTGRPAIYPFAQMRVGDSFEVRLSDYTGKRKTINAMQNVLSNCARKYALDHRPGAKFVTRQIGGAAVRVWRVK